MHTPITACRVCGNRELVEILDLGEQSLTGAFPRDISESIERGPLRLVKCEGPGVCGLVQLAHSYDSDELYGDNYGYRSGLNLSMVRHLQGKVDRILSGFDLAPGSLVVDIGSNDGTTLAAYPNHFRRIGIDPTSSKFLEYYEPGIEVVPAFFSTDVLRGVAGDTKASVITSFAMFYDLEDPIQFMAEVAESLAAKGIWVFEQSYLPLMLERNAYDTVCQEHVEYYSLTQIAWMAQKAGLALIDVEFNDVNGGSFSVTAGRVSDGYTDAAAVDQVLQREAELGVNGLDLYRAFAARVEESKVALRGFIDEAIDTGRRIGGLGASTKGNVILQYCGVTPREIVAIGEVNEDKFGSYTPGTLIPIRPEGEVLGLGLDYLLVLPWHFRQSFVNMTIPAGTQLVFPLPYLEVIEPAGEPRSG
jgi:NDP-4-keto-2,6-dideoxyhexose 3-C-methyltransferase